MRRLSVNLPQSALLAIHKSFIRPHLDYGDTNNKNFQNEIKKLQYKACLEITGAMRGTSREKLYEQLRLLKEAGTVNQLSFIK